MPTIVITRCIDSCNPVATDSSLRRIIGHFCVARFSTSASFSFFPFFLSFFLPLLLPFLNFTLLFYRFLDERSQLRSKEQSTVCPFYFIPGTLYSQRFVAIFRPCYSKSCTELKGSSRSPYAARTYSSFAK